MVTTLLSQFGQMLDKALLGLIVLSRDGRILEANHTLLHMFGYDEHELRGKAIELLVPEDHREIHPVYREQFIQSGFILSGHEHDLKGRRKDGSLFSVEVRLSSIPYGQEVAPVAIVIDTTARKQIERERDTLLAQEQQARAQAENMQRRQAFLAQASNIITSSLDYETTLTALAQTALPFLGDSCMIDLLQHGRMQRVAAVHINPAKHTLVQDIWRNFEPVVTESHPLATLLTEGKPILLPQVQEEHIRRAAFDEHHFQVMQSIQICSMMIVPLIVRESIIGAISLFISESDRHYTEQDIQTAKEFAALAAQALENARLFRELEDAIQQKNETVALLETIVSSAPFGFAFLDGDQRYRMINASLAMLSGQPIESYIGKMPEEAVPEFSPFIMPNLRYVQEHNQPLLNLEFTAPAPPSSPELKHWMMHYYPVSTHQGAFLGVGILLVDITQAKRAAQAIARYKILADHGSDIFLFLTYDGTIIEANRAACHAYGYEYTALCGMNFAALQESSHRIDITRSQREPGESQCESIHLRRDGQPFPVDIVLFHSEIEGTPVVACTIRDISERKRAEEDRQAREAQFRMLAQNAHDIIYRYQYQEPIGFSYVSPSSTKILGYTPEEHYADPKLGEKIIHPDDLPMILTHNPAENPSTPVVFRWVCKDRSIRWAEQHITPIYDTAGKLVAIEGIARDITERKIDEEARGRLAAIVNSSEDAIIGVNLQNIIVSWNSGAEKLTGYTAEEVIGQSPLFLIPPEKRNERQQLYNQIKDDQSVMYNETIWCCKNGRKIDVNITISPIRYNDITIGFSAIGRDITEHKQAEQALQRQASLNKLLQVIVAAANKASALESVLETAVDQICLSMGWPLGHVYMATETGFFALVSSNIWHVSDPQQFAAFRSITEMTKIALLDDLPGKVLLSGKAEWTNELTSIDSPLRTKLICESGICAGFAFPVLVGAETVAVLEFFANEPVEPDAQLLEVVEHVGAHLGRVVERARAESAIRASEERYRLIADNTADLITMIDQQGMIIYASPSYAWVLGINPTNLLGDSIYNHIHPHEQERAKRTWSYSITDLESQITIRMRAKTGEWRSIAIRGMHTAQRDQHYLVCVGHDVTEQLRSEEALRTAEARYRTLVEQIPAIIYTTPLEHQAHASYISPQLFSILGFSPEEWLGDPHLWDRQIHPEDRGLVQEISAQTQQRRQTYTSEYRIFSRDGRLVWVQDTARVVYDEQETPLFVQGIALDITDRKQAEEALRRSEQLYRALTHNFPNGSVILFDQNLNITIADGTDLARFNLSSEILEGQSLKGSISTFLYDTIESLCYATLAGEMISREFELRGYFYRAHMLPVRDEHGVIMAGMIMSQDISDYKEATRALAEERTLLARRVEERTADLSAANAELARAARLKDEFLANMSHELRTPLNAVLGLSEALREQAYGPVNERQDRSLQTIEESGRHLLELINDILDLAKVGAGKMELFLEPTSIDMICQTSLRLIRQSALKKSITIQTSIDPQAKQIVADPRRLKQILVNLTSNAVKFTPEGGRIGMEVVADEMQQAIHFTVWDTGIGIAADQLEQLFQPFVQLDSSLSRHYEGTGLGLALVYRMTELHGGSVSASSIQGEGSTFRISLPWKKADSPPGPVQISTPEVPSAIRFKRALIIEDSQTSAEHIARYLGEYQIETKIVPVGGVALMTAKELQPDLIFLDLLLPDISGWDVLAQLKADDQTRDAPVVIISVVDDQRQGSEMGAIAHMTKPCTRAALRQVLHHITPGVAGPFISNVCEQPPTILLAEDNESNILTIADYLENTGYHVVVARNGAEAIAQAREVRPKLILMDIQMPGMDGLEATKRIRADPQIGSIPILAMTALAMPGDRERCLDAGATDYMSKPISLHQLTDTIDSLI